MKRYFTGLVCSIVFTIVCSEIVLAQPRNSIVISELMPDPTPPVGLPNAEWIELHNTTAQAINLQGFRIGKPGTSPSGPMPPLILPPDSAVIVCTAGQVGALSVFGRTAAVTSFPSLANDGDLIFVQNSAGEVVHAVQYNIGWYKNALKAEGGWSLEMTDTRHACQGIDNWQASTDARGGTPGQPNATRRTNADTRAPVLLRAYAPGARQLLLSFNEPIIPGGNAAANFAVSDGMVVLQAEAQPPTFQQVLLTLQSDLSAGRIYTVRATGITDCSGLPIAPASEARVGLASVCDSLDLVINELLFNPLPQGQDYIELYNRSSKVINMGRLSMANRSSSTGAIGSISRLTADNVLLFPGEYAVFTPAPDDLGRQYTVLNVQALWPLALPSFPDDRGWAVLLNEQGALVDELPYDRKWHFALLDNDEGVALERIDYDAPTARPDNWTSAARSAGFGTPTARNSQFRADLQPQADISIQPSMFSPDNDGFEDFALLQFKFPEPGYVANITIMDAAGRPVRVLQRNATCAATGSFRWDGLNDKQQKVPVGTYIFFTEIFNLKGQKRVFKNTVTVAARF